jgi:hypothetical protein
MTVWPQYVILALYAVSLFAGIVTNKVSTVLAVLFGLWVLYMGSFWDVLLTSWGY